MWALIFVYIINDVAYAETVSMHSSMTQCFYAREELSSSVGNGYGYFKPGEQAVCISMSADTQL